MFRGKNTWKKGTAAVVVSALVVGILPKSLLSLNDVMGEFKVVQAETIMSEANTDVEIPSILQVSADFFDYNISSCEKNGKTISATDKILLNQYTRQTAQTVSPSAVENKNLFLFGGKRTTDGEQNTWTGVRMAQYEGIVEKKLVNGNIQFANDIYGVNIFPSQEEYEAAANESGELTLQDVVKPYYGKEFQFIYKDGIYIFDSGKHGISGVSADNKVSVDFENPGPVFGSGTGTDKNITGFFPFNTKDENNKAVESRHHMFGMKLTIPFTLTESGKVKLQDGTEKDMVFNFSGDDDVWIFIDGNMAIDLGGIHDKVSAHINFATGQIVYDQNASGGKGHGIKNIYEDKVISPAVVSTGAIHKSTSHTLTVFYLERGEYDSNCSIDFNISAEGEKIIPTSAPVVTTAPAITVVPTITTVPAITTVTPSATPVLETPSVETDEPATPPVSKTNPPATVAPVSKTNPPATVVPVSKTNPPVTLKPTDSPKPIKTPETEEAKSTKVPVVETLAPTTVVEDTMAPTNTPIPTPAVTIQPTKTPIDINVPEPTEDIIIEETQVPDMFVTAEPTIAPEETNEPDSGKEPAAVPTSTPVIIEEQENPSSGVRVSPTPKVETTKIPDNEKENEDLTDVIVEDDIPSKNPIEDTEVIVEDNIPSVLPKTGAIGALVKNHHVVWYGLLILEAIMAAGIGLFGRKRRKKS